MRYVKSRTVYLPIFAVGITKKEEPEPTTPCQIRVFKDVSFLRSFPSEKKDRLSGRETQDTALSRRELQPALFSAAKKDARVHRSGRLDGHGNGSVL